MSLFDLAPFVATLSDSTGTITRYATSPYGSNGKAAAKTVASNTSAQVSFQPVSSRLDRDAMGFGPTDILWTVFCSTSLQIGDRLTVSGLSYEVERVEAWNQIGNYSEAIVRQLDGSEP